MRLISDVDRCPAREGAPKASQGDDEILTVRSHSDDSQEERHLHPCVANGILLES